MTKINQLGAISDGGFMVPMAVLAGLAALFFTAQNFIGAQKDSFDLHLVLGATQAFARHSDPYMGWLNFKHGLAGDPGYESQYPPSAYILLSPLLLFPWPLAAFVTAAANTGAGALLIGLLRRQAVPNLGVAASFAAGAAFYISTPFQANLLHGQLSLLVLMCFLLAENALRRGRGTAGWLWLTLALVKFSVTLPLALVLWRRDQFRALVCAIAAHGVLFLAAAAWLGENLVTLMSHLMQTESYSLLNGYMNYSKWWRLPFCGGEATHCCCPWRRRHRCSASIIPAMT